MFIEKLSYSIYELHGRLMVEKYINGHYECFTRVKLDSLAKIFGDEFLPSPAKPASFTLSATPEGPHSWTLISTAVYNGEPEIYIHATHEEVRELLEKTPAVRMSYVYPGDDVEVNYTYREANEANESRATVTDEEMDSLLS